MNDHKIATHRINLVKTVLVHAFLVVVCLFAFCVVFLKLYLETPHAAALLSQKLGSYFQQPVRISGLRGSWRGVSLSGVSLDNPSDVSSSRLVEIDTVTIAPDWGRIAKGERRIRLIALDGVRIKLRKSKGGEWNYSRLLQRAGSKKIEGNEWIIEQLVLKNGAIQVNGLEAKGVSLDLANLATGGSSDAQVRLSFNDAVRNIYSISGTMRPGSRPALDLTLSAPSLSIKGLAGMWEPDYSTLFGYDRGNLMARVTLGGGRLRCSGQLDLGHVPTPPLHNRGYIAAEVSYDIKSDVAHLENISISLARFMSAHAAGTISGVKSEKRYAFDVNIEEAVLAPVAFLLPVAERERTRAKGRLRDTVLHVSGTAKDGLSGVNGIIKLADGSIERDGRLIFNNLAGTMTISKMPEGVMAKGALSHVGVEGTTLIESLHAPFEVMLSPRLKPLKGHISNFRANAVGLAVTGGAGYDAALPAPFRVALMAPGVPLSTLRKLPGMPDLQITHGSAALALEGRGRGVRDFSATASVRISDLRGVRGGGFTIKEGVFDSEISRSDGKVSSIGRCDFSGVSIAGKQADVRFGYRVENGMASFGDALFTVDGTTGRIPLITVMIPRKELMAEGERYPLRIDLAGGEIQRNPARLKGVEGTFRGHMYSVARDRWLEGDARLSAGTIEWQGNAIASPAFRAVFSRAGGRGVASGEFLEGALTGTFAFAPFSLRNGGEFRFGIKGGRLSTLGKFAARRRGEIDFLNGSLDGELYGRYSENTGSDLHFDTRGTGVSVVGDSGKTLVRDGGFTLAGGISGDRLLLEKGLLSPGAGVALQVKGQLQKYFAPERSGYFDFTLSRMPINSLIDPIVNLLPRIIQEATLDGTVAAEGRMELGDGRQLLDGRLALEHAIIEVPSQKLRVADIRGTFPFSLDLSGSMQVKENQQPNFTRENYHGLLTRLRLAGQDGQTLAIGGIDIGSLSFGEAVIHISSGNGVTRIDSLHSSLHGGELLGAGFLAIKKGVSYRADLLVNGLSLKQFCASIPSIRDYISGRLDGGISIGGKGGGVAGVAGFTDLWVREGGGERMFVSREFLQKLSGKKLSGIFFSSDRPFDRAEVTAVLENGYLTFEKLDISNTNLFGVRDLSVSIAPAGNRIALDHLLNAVTQAVVRGKAAGGGEAPPAGQEFKWQD